MTGVQTCALPISRLLIPGLRVELQQTRYRPAVVLSPASYNGKTGLMVCCPMTTKIKGHPFEVVAQVDGVDCAVLSDQVKSLDWKVRQAKKKGVVSAEVMLHVRAKMKALLQIP